MAGLDVTPRRESCSTIRASSPVSIRPRESWSSHTLVPAAVSAARRSFTAVALIHGTMPRLPVRRALIALLAVAALLAAPTRAAAAPNFVFVLTDDLSTDLLDYMPRVQAMQRQGTSFDSYIVTDSLCCPSRASIFTGRYPHSTGVITNGPPRGGFPVFTRVEEKSTFATSLQAAGYRTGLMGKYLNGYTVGRRFVPPGWSAWAVAGNGYANFNYGLLVKNPGGQPQVKRYGSKPNDYLTDVISRRGQQFIAGAVRARAPFMLELSTFAPHEP